MLFAATAAGVLWLSAPKNFAKPSEMKNGSIIVRLKVNAQRFSEFFFGLYHNNRRIYINYAWISMCGFMTGKYDFYQNFYHPSNEFSMLMIESNTTIQYNTHSLPLTHTNTVNNRPHNSHLSFCFGQNVWFYPCLYFNKNVSWFFIAFINPEQWTFCDVIFRSSKS